MNWVFSKIEKVASTFDNLTSYNQLDNPGNAEVAAFIQNYHALAFEIPPYRRMHTNQLLDMPLCETMVKRIETMNDFLLFYQSTDDLFDVVTNLRQHYHMEELLTLKNEIVQKMIAQQNQQQMQVPPYYNGMQQDVIMSNPNNSSSIYIPINNL